ncbi:MAG TPA: hypothetical protein VFR15_13475 [Chloroflexia bacterium]|nr:hypothetical protein [Chloroflexia bacterium]
MVTLGALFGQFKGVFGKPYLLAGILPAVFFTFGWLYLTGDWASALDRVATVDKNTPAKTLSAGLVILLLGVVFFASRTVLLRITQTMPGTLLTPLRNAWTRKRLEARSAAIAARQKVVHELTAVRWYKHDFVEPTYITEGVEEVGDTVEVINRSSDARAAIGEVRRKANGARPNETQAERITAGLAALYVHTVKNAPATAAEVQNWRDLMDEEESIEVVERAAELLQRMYGQRVSAVQAMPDVVSVKPTALGNCFASMEDYSYRRYKMDTTTMFNRIWGVLTKDQRSEIADTQLTVEVLVSLSWCAALLGVGTLISYAAIGVLVGPGSLLRVPAVLGQGVGFVALAVLFYHGALLAAGELQSKVTRAIDLNRIPMIKKLGYAVPATVAEELLFFQELQGFFVQANARDGARKLRP